jgi:hypothetical protein
VGKVSLPPKLALKIYGLALQAHSSLDRATGSDWSEFISYYERYRNSITTLLDEIYPKYELALNLPERKSRLSDLGLRILRLANPAWRRQSVGITIEQIHLTLHAFCHLLDLLDREEKPRPHSIILLRRQFCLVIFAMEKVLRGRSRAERIRIPYFGKLEGDHAELPPETWVSI